MARSSAPSARRAVAAQSFRTAADCIGTITEGMALFAITRGQFSMIDVVLACLEQTGPAAVSLWTWTVADYEVQCLEAMQRDGRIESGTLIIDHGARKKNAAIIANWKRSYGPSSVRYVINHAKIATIETRRFRLLLRGSMNLNMNPRFEQLDITEGGPDFDLVREIENELPILPDDCGGNDVYKASRVGEAFDPETLELFQGIKVWAK